MNYAIAIILTAGLTYLIRMLPLAFFQKQIQNQWIKSFLYYIPYAVLSAMTFPAIFYSTGSFPSALAGFVTAAILAYFGRGLMTTALSAVAVACIVGLLI